MTSIKMIEVEEATGKVKEIYQQIMDEIGIDFVPNIYKVIAPREERLCCSSSMSGKSPWSNTNRS
jgi:division protein CdvB (Snf7/Vps24/ESCRT-III family)